MPERVTQLPSRKIVLDPSRYEPVGVEFDDATPEQVARALFAAAPPPDPKKRKDRAPST